MHNKKAQIDIPVVTWIVIIIAICILSPILLHLVNVILVPMGNAVADMSPQANISAQHVVQQTNNFWDFSMVLMFLIITIMLFVSAYFIDVHPLFIVFYIIIAFILFLIITPMSAMLTQFYSSDGSINPFNTTVQHLPFTSFFASYFWQLCFILYIVSGIIMYGKLRSRNVW